MNTRMVLYSMIGIFAYVPGWFQSAQSRAGRAKLVDELTEFIMRGILA
jgi:hypothetical protein